MLETLKHRRNFNMISNNDTNEQLTKALTALSGRSNNDLCRWWCLMNCWIWPDDMPIDKPDDWDKCRPQGKSLILISSAAWKALNIMTTRKDRLQFWNGEFFKQGRCNKRNQ